VTYTKSSIGYSERQKRTVESLGLRRLGDTVIQMDTPPIRGMIASVQHLVSVRNVDEPEVTAVKKGADGAEKL
jgi:large subunit ribosomal protein L30